jgi:hypothetical protein
LFVLLTACGQGPEADLQYIKQARSISAEWALVNEQADAGRLTLTYVQSMHRWLHDGLETASGSLSDPKSRYGAEFRALLAEPPGAAPAELRRHADVLKEIERQFESA